IDLVQALLLRRVLGRGVVVRILVVDLGIVHARPVGLAHLQPAAEGAEPPFQHPFRLALLGRNEAHRVLVEALGREIHLDVGDEAVFVLLAERGDFLAGFERSHYAASRRAARRAIAASAASASACVEFHPKLTRKAQRASSSGTPIAASTCDGFTLPEEQAAPELTITPSRSSAISEVSAATPGSAKQEVLGRRGAFLPKIWSLKIGPFKPCSKRSRRSAGIAFHAAAAAPK